MAQKRESNNSTRPTHRRATSEVKDYLNNQTYDINIVDRVMKNLGSYQTVDRSANNSVMGGTTLSNFSETEDLSPFGSRRNSKSQLHGKSKAFKYVKIPK